LEKSIIRLDGISGPTLELDANDDDPPLGKMLGKILPLKWLCDLAAHQNTPILYSALKNVVVLDI